MDRYRTLVITISCQNCSTKHERDPSCVTLLATEISTLLLRYTPRPLVNQFFFPPARMQFTKFPFNFLLDTVWQIGFFRARAKIRSSRAERTGTYFAAAL